MTGSPLKLGLALVLTASAYALGPVQDVQEMFRQGVDLLQRGKDDEALRMFQKVLAADPSHEQAYELWQSTDNQIWLDIMTRGGDWELIAKRLTGLSEVGRTERKQDPEAIKKLLKDIKSDTDLMARTAATRQLAAEHGEFAVPYMLPTLADQGDDDGRVLYMQALAHMGTDVVPPLMEALRASDPYLRRNVALTLGYIGDPRAAGALAAAAASDENDGVRAAAAEALKKVDGGSDAVADWVVLGDMYSYRRPEVIDQHPHANGVWTWKGDKLEFVPVLPAVYADEIARKAYAAALALDPSNAQAQRGWARVNAAEASRLVALAEAGTDLGNMAPTLEHCVIATRLAGAEALDGALSDALANQDALSAQALATALYGVAMHPLPGLTSALSTGDGGSRAAAALTLGEAAVLSRGKASADVVAQLAQNAAREVVRVVALFDADATRAQAIAHAFRGAGVDVMHFDRAALGLAMLHRAPGVDAVIVADRLPDLTAAQVVSDVASDEQLAKAPVYIITADVAGAQDVWADKVKGFLTGEAEVAAIVDALSALEGDRKRAVEIAAASAQILAELARGSTDLSPVLSALRTAAQAQPDVVATSAMRSLAVAGDAAAAEDLANIAADGKRSEAARTAAAQAAGRSFARGVAAADAAVTALRGVLTSDAPVGLRIAVAGALGSAPLSPADRAELAKSGLATPQ